MVHLLFDFIPSVNTHEFGEYFFERFPERLRQDIQASSVWHRDDNIVNAVFGRNVHKMTQSVDERVTTFEAETFRGGPLVLHEIRETLVAQQTLINLPFLIGIQDERFVLLDVFADPFAFRSIRDVLELVASVLTIYSVQFFYNFSQGPSRFF